MFCHYYVVPVMFSCISYALSSIYEQCNTSLLVGLDKYMEETETTEKWKQATEETEKGRRYKCIAVKF